MPRIKAPVENDTPASELTEGQVLAIRALAYAQMAHPSWSLTTVISKAADIVHGTFQASPRGTNDEMLTRGLKALIPEDWEKNVA